MRIALLALLVLASQDDEVSVPEFNGSYVVALPDGYDAAKTWPLILDFHGAIHPSQKGATLTRRELWSRFVRRVPCVVVGLNGRTTAWGMTTGDKDDVAYALHVLAEARKKYSIDPKRIYLAGFSSGSDFLCSSNLQLKGPFAGSLVCCPGPPNVLGIEGLPKVKDHPFLFVTGEEDYIRKDGAWQAFLALDKLGARVMYREVPGVDHDFFDIDEYVRLFRQLEGVVDVDDALRRGDYLLASTHLKDEKRLKEIEAKGRALLAEAETIQDPGRAHEAWWRLRTQFHRFPELAARAQKELDKRGDLLKERGDWFDRRRPLWTFDRYLTWREITLHVRDLARRHPGRAKLLSMGLSVEGRDLWVLELTDTSTGAAADKPAAYIEGALHGNEISATMTTLYFAWQLAANPSKSRSIDRLMSESVIYIAPAVNADGVHHFMDEPHSHWRPRFNYRPHDADGDRRVDEDPYEDLDGDGEIGQMYRPSEKGEFVLKDGRLVRGEGATRYEHVGREGIDNDGDGKFSEDPPGGVNLNRNFPVGFSSRRDFEGSTGEKGVPEPETQAVMKFVTDRPNISLFLDYHNDAKCLFYWRPGKERELYEKIAARAEKKLGYKPEPLDHEGAGLAIAWGWGDRGLLSFIVELEGQEWPDSFMPAKPFKHPQLGDILLGDDHTKLAKRNPRPDAIKDVAEKNWSWLKEELARLPRLELKNPRIERTRDGFVVTGEIAKEGEFPLGPGKTTIEAEGATLTGGIDGGTFRVVLGKPGDSVTLFLRHPRGGTIRYPVLRPRSATRPVRREYAIQEGHATPDKAKTVALKEDKGPAFVLKHRKPELKVGVVLGEWKDLRHSVAASEIEKAFFGGYDGTSSTGQHIYGSLNDFYREMSYGEFKLAGKVFDWVELPGSWKEVRDENFGSDVVERRMMEAVGAKALEEFDALAFVWAGNSVSRVSALWPMRIDVKGKVAFKTGELYRGEAAPIGVAGHELGHTFGVDDKYGVSRNPLGPWCLMARGTHGGEPSAEHRPFHFCAWCKMVIGWVKPAVIDPSTPQKLALRPILFAPTESFRILLKPDGSEYLLLENRRREGFFTDLPSPGLAVYRVGPNDVPATPQVRVQLLPAHGEGVARRGVVAKPETVAWPQKRRTELVVEGVRLSNIRLVDDVIYFEVGPAR